jgi:hypothetical protein
MSNKIVIASLIAGLTFGSQIVSAQTRRCWTTAGSTGTVNETDLSEVNLTSDRVETNGALDTPDALIRYNVVAVDGVFGTVDKVLRVRFTDNGEAARVTLSLFRINIFNGAGAILARFDSNDYAPSNRPQTQRVECSRFDGGDLDFQNNIRRAMEGRRPRREARDSPEGALRKL